MPFKIDIKPLRRFIMKKLILSAALFSILLQPIQSYAMDEVMVEASQQALEGYRDLYKQQIEKRFADIYSGFHHQYQIKPNENTFYARATRSDVEFYAALATLIYAKDASDQTSDASITDSIKAKLGELHRTGYEFLGLMKRSGNEHSSGLFYNQASNHVIWVWAGTKTNTDFVIDANYLKFSGKDEFGAFNTPKGEKLSVHNGFAKAYLEGIKGFTQQFGELLSKYSDHIRNYRLKLRVTTTGHSLGGALSTLAANDMNRILREAGLASSPNDFTIENITFASPRVFGPESAEIVERSLGGKHNILAFRDKRDPIPMVPPSWTYSKHVGTPFYIGEDGLPDITIQKHFMANYIDKVGPVFESIKRDAEYREFVEGSIKHYKAALGDTSPDNFEAYEILNSLKVQYDEEGKAGSFFKAQLTQAKAAKDSEKIAATEEILKGIKHKKKELKKAMEDERQKIKKLLGKKSFAFFSPSTWF
jgi:hypothetical protein